MGEDLIQADYEALDGIAKRFGDQASQQAALRERVRRSVEALARGGWQGEGARAFLSEMQGEIMPAMARLIDGLEEAQSVTVIVAEVVRDAEEEAAAPFRTDGAALPPPGDGTVFPGMGDAGGGGGGGGMRAGAPAGEGPGMARGFWDGFELKGDGKIWTFDVAQPPGKEGRYDAYVGLKYGVDGAVLGDPSEDGFSVGGYDAGLKAGYGREGLTVGPYGSFYAVQAQADGVLLGDKQLGLTGGVKAKVLAAEGFAGFKDGSIGYGVGATLISAEGSVGMNVAGRNVRGTLEVGLKAELGFKVGDKTEIRLPFVTLGFNFGKAVH